MFSTNKYDVHVYTLLCDRKGVISFATVEGIADAPWCFWVGENPLGINAPFALYFCNTFNSCQVLYKFKAQNYRVQGTAGNSSWEHVAIPFFCTWSFLSSCKPALSAYSRKLLSRACRTWTQTLVVEAPKSTHQKVPARQGNQSSLPKQTVYAQFYKPLMSVFVEQ